jgi:hypothetical protein
MTDPRPRRFLELASRAAAASSFLPVIRRALALPASNRTGTIEDVEHIRERFTNGARLCRTACRYRGLLTDSCVHSGR